MEILRQTRPRMYWSLQAAFWGLSAYIAAIFLTVLWILNYSKRSDFLAIPFLLFVYFNYFSTCSRWLKLYMQKLATGKETVIR